MPITLNGSTGFAGANGTASVPAFQGEDPASGVFFPATGVVAVTTGGTERMRIDAFGRITTPSQPVAYGRITTRTSSSSNYVATLLNLASRGGMSASSDRITVPVARFYLVSFNQLVNTAGITAYYEIRRNGATFCHAYSNGDDTYDVTQTAIIQMSANDYIDFYVTGTTTYTWGEAHSNWLVALLG